jgi:uncharacterized protein with von Willebrand factor type A (vWA) domain
MKLACGLLVVVLVGVADARTKRVPTAVVLLVDRSGSMQGPKLDSAKEAARVAVETLQQGDEISIITFDSDAQVVVPMAVPKDKKPVSDAIGQIVSGGGTSFAPALRAAKEQLAHATAANRLVLLMTDGESPSDGVVDLVDSLDAGGATVSAIGVQGADRVLLQEISTRGHGRLYMVEDLGALPKIFMKEILEASQPAAKGKLVPTAIAVVIDRSGSMQGPRLEAAKQGPLAVLDALADADWFTLIAFDSDAQTYVPIGKVGQAPRTKQKNDIQRLDAGGGTNIYPGLKIAMEQLAQVKATNKHVLLLTDGEAPDDGIDALVADMLQAHITISAVGIGDADAALLRRITDRGLGRLYLVKDPTAITNVFVRDAEDARHAP